MRRAFSKLLAAVWITASLSYFSFSSFAGGLVATWGNNTYGTVVLPVGVNNIKAVACGPVHDLALKANGTVIGWGDNYYGAISSVGLSNITAIAVGERHSLALRAKGTVVAWGDNAWGQTNIPAGLSNVIAIAAGYRHNLALKADGNIVAWGADDQGQTNVPAGLSNVVAIVAGPYDSLALKSDGTVVAWGYDFGNGKTNVPPNLSDAVAITTGFYQSLALKADGTVVAWGSNSYGQTNVPIGLSNVVAIAAGTYQSLALKADGTLVHWGVDYPSINPPSQLSNITAIAMSGNHGLAIVASGPVQIVQNPQSQRVPYSSNITFSMAATGDDPLGYQWLLNGRAITNTPHIFGETNNVLNIPSSDFNDTGTYTVIVSNMFGAVRSDAATLVVTSAPVVIASLTNQIVLAGADLTLAVNVIGSPPLTYRWMFNGIPINGKTTPSLSLTNVQTGQNGIYSLIISNAYGIITNSITISVAASAPYILIEPTNRTALYGGSAICSVAARGTAPLFYQWRWNGQDILGATNTSLALTSLRPENSGFYSVIVSNNIGQTASAKAYLSVAQIALWSSSQLRAGLTNPPPGLTNVIAISAGQNYLMALKANGTVAAWGEAATNSATNGFHLPPSPIGANFDLPTNVPPNLSNVVAIAAGNYHGLALKANGTVMAWGDNTYGQTNVPTGLSNVIAIAAGATHSLALKSDSRVVEWGQYNSELIRPPGETAFTNYPPPILSNVIAIAAGNIHDMAVRSDGTVVYWGASTNFPSGISNVIAASFLDTTTTYSFPIGKVHSYSVLRADGTVILWSDGNSIVPPDASPPSITGVSNVVAISGNANLISSGTVYIPPVGSRPPQNISNVIAIASSWSTPLLNNTPPYLLPINTGGNFYAAVIGDGSPFITIQPMSQSVGKGSQVQFHARAVGNPPLKYQWQFNNHNIFGATNNDLVISNASIGDIGDYRFLADNSFGSITSKVTQLTISFSTNLAAALNATNLLWETFMSTNKMPSWFAENQITHDGDAAAQSGAISDNQRSYLITPITGPGTLTFWWKVSSEEDYDFLNFYLDNATNPLVHISGEMDWRNETVAIPSGTHVARWIYSKDGNVSVGEDAGWLDEVNFIPVAPLTLTAPRMLPDKSFVFATDAASDLSPTNNLAAFEVQASTDLVNWITLTNGLVSTNGGLEMHDAADTNYPARFYRIIQH
ncbi:MAG: immunoglobulin domain-containing protein [Limisphaerales bacterium]